LPGPYTVKQRIVGFDAQKKSIARSQRKSRHVENRMVWRGQAVHCQHPEYSGGCANKIVISNVMGMNAGQLLSGLPPTFMG